ncbi:MAG: polyprenyl synthetase family protein [Alphaproteobacteria bacterium]|nr:polyprenyl synthetase family protein [Alphaproteobacteria bacterium]
MIMLSGGLVASSTKIQPASLQPLLRLYGEGLAQTNQLIQSTADSSILLIPKVAHHLLDAGGKRIRSLLLLASADLVCQLSGTAYQQQKILNLSAAVEMIHTATLLHDDVVDNSTLRRGKPTANKIWDNKLPILVGDYLFSCAFMLMVKSESLKVLEMLSAVSAELAEGEVLQLQYEGDAGLSREIYQQIITAKTASLFRAASYAGAIVGCDDENLKQILKQFGHEFGILFQLIDDMMDYHVSADMMGKISGDDLREGKVTLPLIILREKLNEAQQQWLADVISKKEANDNDLAKIQELMTQYHIAEEMRGEIAVYGDRLNHSLEKLADGAPKQSLPIIDALHQAVQFSLQRIY